MTIYVKNSSDGGLEVIAGRIRLNAMLEVQGKALVHNTSTNEQLEVHKVGGQLIAMTLDTASELKSLASAVISNAAKR